MDIGTVAQWAAVCASLMLGTRSEIRAYRERRIDRVKDEAGAIGRLIEVFRRAERLLPPDPTGVLSGVYKPGQEELRQVIVSLRESIALIASAYPSGAVELIELADLLDDMTTWAIEHGEDSSASKNLLQQYIAIYQALRLLAIPVAARVKWRGDLVTNRTYTDDRYAKEFEARYRRFLAARTNLMYFPNLLE